MPSLRLDSRRIRRGFTLFFVLFSVVCCRALEGAKRTAIFFAVSELVTYAMEEAGVRTGLVFGAYRYSDQLDIKLGHVIAVFSMGMPAFVSLIQIYVKASAAQEIPASATVTSHHLAGSGDSRLKNRPRESVRLGL
jgi:uncharacterized membrane protein